MSIRAFHAKNYTLIWIDLPPGTAIYMIGPNDTSGEPLARLAVHNLAIANPSGGIAGIYH